MLKGPQNWKLSPPPKWLIWLFLPVFTVAAARLTFVGPDTNMLPLLAASLIFLAWSSYAKRT